MVKRRLAGVARVWEGTPWLEQQFTAADLLMVTVLRILRHTSLVSLHPMLADYQKRCEDRDTFQRALAAQLAAFVDTALC